MTRQKLILCGIAFLASSTVVFDSTKSAHPPAAGTYEMLICKGPCSFSEPTDVVVRGTIVLMEKVFNVDDLNKVSPAPFVGAYSSARIGAPSIDGPNGCFVLELVDGGRTYAGLISFGLTQWSVRADMMSFDLYASVDAWHGVYVKLSATGFAGEGHSGGVGAAEPYYDPDTIIGRRVGAANLGNCISAAQKREKVAGAV